MVNKKEKTLILVVTIILISTLIIHIHAASTGTARLYIEPTMATGWQAIIPPEGVFEPENNALSGTHITSFVIKFDTFLQSLNVTAIDLQFVLSISYQNNKYNTP